MEHYEISEEAARDLAEIVHAYKAGKLTPTPANPSRRRPAVYAPIWYRLATNSAGGVYLLRKQAWNDSTNSFADVADDNDAEYNRDVTGHDFRGRDDGTAGAAGIGQIVRGWKLFVNDEWVTLVDVGEAAGAPYSFATLPEFWECFTVRYGWDSAGRCIGWYYGDEHAWESPWDVPDPGVYS